MQPNSLLRSARLLCLLLLLSLASLHHTEALSPQVDSQPQDTQSRTGLVVSASAPASDAGAAILQQGGNAVDAAVATAFALAVTWPTAGNIGGGGFMVIRRPNGEAITLDYRETAPLKATPTMFLDSKGEIDRSLIATGYLGVGVPGTVRGLEMAHKKYGKLPWKQVLMPAVKLAEEGFILSASLASALNRVAPNKMEKFPASVEAYSKPGGGNWVAGDRLILKDLGKTLRAIATDGPDVFYKGWVADLIAEDMKANGGLITKEDLAAYQAIWRQPVRGSFRGYEIITMPPSSAGGVTLIEMLNILENFDLRKHGRFAPETLHTMVETMRRAYLDRARFLGDPAFNDLPIARLLSKSYAKDLAASIKADQATSSVELGKDMVKVAQPKESDETTHFSVIDKDGMAVSNTYTLEAAYGSGVVVKGAGFLLNNEMGDFNRKPGETNLQGDIGTPANIIAPGKRMLSSMTPTIITRNGQLFMVTGSPGGRTITNTVLEIILNVIEFEMTPRQAVDAPRMHHQWLPDNIRMEAGEPSDAVLATLKEKGHDIQRAQGSQGDGHTIVVDMKTKIAVGINDRRNANSKASK